MKDKEIEIVESLFSDACQIIEEAQSLAYKAINVTLIKRNWLLGMRMQHEVMRDKRAEYGERIVKTLARKLTRRYGKGFTWRNLYNYLDFYEKYSHFFVLDNNHFQILHAARAKSVYHGDGEIDTRPRDTPEKACIQITPKIYLNATFLNTWTPRITPVMRLPYWS